MKTNVQLKTRKPRTAARIFKAVWIFIPLMLAAAMYFLLPMFPQFTEYVVSRGLFKIYTVPVGFITSLIPLSLTEIVVVLAAPLVISLIVLLVVKLVKSRSRKVTLINAGRFLAGFVSFAAFIYMTAHGANYYRMSMENLMELDTSEKSAETLFSVCCYLGEKAGDARIGLEEDDRGNVIFSEDIYTELTRAASGYEPLIREYPFLWTSVGRQKPVQLSYYWSYTGTTGMYFPFFAECNVNIEQPDFAVPFTAAHESAHSRGIALENECNFLAFLSCINSEYPEYRYSGYYYGLKHCLNALYRYDKDMWKRAYAYVSDGTARDFARENEYINAFKGEIRNVSGKVNDTFIKVQGVPDGRLSYDRVTELILAYYCKLSEA